MDRKSGLGTALRKIRRERDYTQEGFAKLLGISRSFLSEIETGRKNPSVQQLQDISMELQIPVAVLYLKAMGLDDIPHANRDEIMKSIRPLIAEIESYFTAEVTS